MTRHSRQLENGKSDIHPGAEVEAIYRPTGTRARYRAHEIDGALRMKPATASLPECGLESLVVLKVIRRGFGK